MEKLWTWTLSEVKFWSCSSDGELKVGLCAFRLYSMCLDVDGASSQSQTLKSPDFCHFSSVITFYAIFGANSHKQFGCYIVFKITRMLLMLQCFYTVWMDGLNDYSVIFNKKMCVNRDFSVF